MPSSRKRTRASATEEHSTLPETTEAVCQCNFCYEKRQEAVAPTPEGVSPSKSVEESRQAVKELQKAVGTAIDDNHKILSNDEFVDEHKPKIQKMQEIAGFLKSAKLAVDSMCEAFECSITNELPLDPVMAQDGNVYERWAIEEWFTKSPGPEAKSPLNGDMIAKGLVPCVQLRNLLTTMVDGGAIRGPKAAAWKLATSNQKKVAELVEQAEEGNVHAMRRLGFSYRDGRRGVRVDAAKAVGYFRTAAELRDPRSNTALGSAYINGVGVAKNVTRGVTFMAIGATLGSEHARGILGWANECGDYGFDVDLEEAKSWYKKMETAECKDSADECRERAHKFLEENP